MSEDVQLSHVSMDFGRFRAVGRDPGLRAGRTIAGDTVDSYGLSRLHPDLRPQHKLFVWNRATIRGRFPVIRYVIDDVQDLLAKAEVAAHFPRAMKIVAKPRLGN